MRLTISNCRSGTDSTFTLKPFSSRYLAYSSQHPHCRGLYMVAVFASSAAAGETAKSADRKSVVKGKSVSVRVDLGGLRIFKKKTTTTNNTINELNNQKTK